MSLARTNTSLILSIQVFMKTISLKKKSQTSGMKVLHPCLIDAGRQGGCRWGTLNMMWIISKHWILIDWQYTSCGYSINFHFLFIKNIWGTFRHYVELQFQKLQITIMWGTLDNFEFCKLNSILKKWSFWTAILWMIFNLAVFELTCLLFVSANWKSTPQTSYPSGKLVSMESPGYIRKR